MPSLWQVMVGGGRVSVLFAPAVTQVVTDHGAPWRNEGTSQALITARSGHHIPSLPS